MSDNQLLEVIERYLNGEMSQEEATRFEMLRNENVSVNNLVTEHRDFTNLIKQYGERLELERRLNAIHDEIDVHSLKEELMIHPSWIVQLWRNHHSKISVAASIAIFAVLCTMFFTGYLNNHDNNYVKLKLDVDKIKQKTDNLNSRVNNLNVHTAPKPADNPGNFRGTGFAISSNGYIVTNYHVVRDADDVYVQNDEGKSFKSKVIYSDPQSDIAILSINDTAFRSLGAIPYSFKKSESEIGENVFTLGRPRDGVILGAGFLTASTGFKGDTTQYQVSTPVDFGNSGGPLLDNKGNLIGIIDAKETHIEGAAFAVKSSYLLKAIQEIPSDSLQKPLVMNSKNTLTGLNEKQQVKKIRKYVFMVKVYNQ